MKSLWRKFVARFRGKVDWLVVRMTFDLKYTHSEDAHAITCVREWGPFKFQYSSYRAHEYFYIALGQRTFYWHECEVVPEPWYVYD